MVKGISKRVIVVKTPVGSLFDEAIFIINENAASSSDVSADTIIEEACTLADDYVRLNCTEKRHPIKKAFLFPAVCSMLSALLTTLIFLFILFLR